MTTEQNALATREPVVAAEAKAESKGNSNLHSARRAKNDEFYTRIEDVEAELYHYRDKFEDKVVYLNCDDPRWSAFWRYFALNFQHLGLKRLIATHYTGVVEPGAPSFMLEILRGRDEDPATGRIGVDSGVETALEGDGDFRSAECVELLKQSDIVVGNPPFSIFREFIAQIMAHQKQFLVIGNMNAITYKEIWPLVQGNRLWLGVSRTGVGQMWFRVLDDAPDKKGQIIEDGVRYQTIGNSAWFTNMDHARRHEELPLWKKYSPEEYPRYDNYDAINVNKVKEIPADYDGVIGVPITFLGKWNPEQFEIVGCSYGYGRPAGWAESINMAPAVAGKNMYKRVLIRCITQSVAKQVG